jgi:DNA-binding response OmpR family regulator
MRSTGQAVSRSDLAQRVWETDQDSFSNLVDVHISHLRRKIDPPGAVPLIHTVRGRGFLLGRAS